MIDLAHAQNILSAAEVQRDPLPLLISEIAQELELTISPINFTRGNYFGFVHFVDEHFCLVSHKKNGAVVLDLSEMQDGADPPSPGDQVLISTLHGEMKVTVKKLQVTSIKTRMHDQ